MIKCGNLFFSYLFCYNQRNPNRKRHCFKRRSSNSNKVGGIFYRPLFIFDKEGREIAI
jgi:hypothetical protein